MIVKKRNVGFNPLNGSNFFPTFGNEDVVKNTVLEFQSPKRVKFLSNALAQSPLGDEDGVVSIP